MHFRKTIFLAFILFIVIVIAGGIVDIQEIRINHDNNFDYSTYFNKFYEIDLTNDIASELRAKTNTLDLNEKVYSNGRQVAVIFVESQDTDPSRYITSFADLETSLENYWHYVSNGDHSVEITTGGWYTIPTDFFGADANPEYSLDDPYWWPDPLIQDAVTAAEAENFEFLETDNTPKYSDIVIFIPTTYHGASSVSTRQDGVFYKLWFKGHTVQRDFAVTLIGENVEGGIGLEDGLQNWARVAHGMGHCRGLDHTHEPDDSKYALMANAFPDPSTPPNGKNPSGLTVYSQSISGITGWFDNQVNQIEIDFGQSTANPVVVKPRYLDTTAIQSIKIYEGSRDLYYLVEVIGNGDEDQWIENDETGVLIYHVQEQSDGEKLTDTKIDLYTDGESFSSEDGSITITVGHDGNDYTVSVVTTGPPNLDLGITSWRAEDPSAESYDIWVDSPVNGYLEDGGECLYNDPTLGRTCTRNGDPPWIDIDQVGLPNRLYARVHNYGNVEATNVQVEFTSYHLQASLTTGGTVEGESAPVTIAAGTYEEVYIDWSPQPWDPGTEPGAREIIPYHGCVRARIIYNDPTNPDIHPDNDWTQENIGQVDLTPMSPIFGSKTVTFYVGNPFPTPEVYVNVIDTTAERGLWSINGSGLGQFHTINASKTKEFTVTFDPIDSLGVGIHLQAMVVAAHKVLCNSSKEILLRPFGRINIGGTTRYRSDLSLEVFSGNEIVINGTLTSHDVPSDPLIGANGGTVLIKIHNIQDNDVEHYYEPIDNQGKYELIFPHCGAKTQYNITAFYIGNRVLTGTKSDTVNFEADKKECPPASWPSTIPFIAMITLVIIYRRGLKRNYKN